MEITGTGVFSISSTGTVRRKLDCACRRSVEARREFLARPQRMCKRLGDSSVDDDRPTFGNGTHEKSFGKRRSHEQPQVLCAGGLAEDGYILRIAAKFGDVIFFSQ